MGDNRPTWRLFQLAFLLLNLPSITRGDSADRDERRPRDREVEAGLALAFDQQVDRCGASRRSERGVLERYGVEMIGARAEA